MKNSTEHQPQAPPGVIATLTTGFELTTTHIWLILLPCMLDLFYWLGPRLGISQLSRASLSPMLEEPSLQEAAAQLIEMSSSVNIFTSLSIPLLGIPALMGGIVPEQTPLPVEIHEVSNAGLLFVAIIALSLIGLFITAVYLGLIGLALREEQERPSGLAPFAAGVLKSAARLLGLGVVFVILLIMVWLPLLPVAFLVGLIAAEFAAFIMMAGFILVTTYLSLSVPGIVYNHRPLLRSVLESVRLVHGHAMQTMMLLLVIVLISVGTNQLWRLADDGSWLTMVSIAGHAFISTALFVAFFVFYRDRWALAKDKLAAGQGLSV